MAHLRNRCLTLIFAIALLGLGSATPADAIFGLPPGVPIGKSGAKSEPKATVTPTVKPTLKSAITPGARPAITPGAKPAITPGARPAVVPVITPAVKPASTAPATTTTTTTTPIFVPPTASLRPRARASGHPTATGKLSNTAIAAAALAALIALGCLLWGVARMRTFEPHWTLSLRHAIAEAGFRASATWAEFSDWARLGH